MSDTPHLRPYAPEDREACLAIWEAASRHGHPFLGEDVLARQRDLVGDVYLPRAQTTVGYIRDPSTAKALRLKVAYEGDVPDELPDKWQEALRRAYSQDLVRTLQGHYRTLKTGDTLTASYAPGRDTTILLNGEPIISKPGHGLMDALLGLWIGRDPVSEDMRSKILAGGC